MRSVVCQLAQAFSTSKRNTTLERGVQSIL